MISNQFYKKKYLKYKEKYLLLKNQKGGVYFQNEDMYRNILSYFDTNEKLKFFNNIKGLTFDNFQWIINQEFFTEDEIQKLNENCNLYAKNGCLTLLKFARQLNPPCPWDESTCRDAAYGGHLDVLQWARSQDPPCPWDVYTCCYAASGGHLDVLQWARSQDPPCPWDESTCSGAAWGGHLHVLQWLRSQDS